MLAGAPSGGGHRHRDVPMDPKPTTSPAAVSNSQTRVPRLEQFHSCVMRLG